MTSRLPVTVGIDGSRTALIALDWAVEYARTHELPLRILNSVELPEQFVSAVPIPLRDLRTEAEKQSRQLLATVRDRVLAAAPDLAVEQVTSLDPPIRSLLRAAGDSSIVVVGCRGLNPFEGALLGSVSTAVSVHAAGPVAVVRSARLAGPDAPVVVGIDGSPDDGRTLGTAMEAADAAGAGLVVVHAWSDQVLAAAFGAGALVTWEEVRVAAAELVERQLAGWSGKYPDVRITTRIVQDDPAGVLLAAGKDAGLLVVGSHGRGGFAGMRLGSIARRLVHHAECPVLVARKAGPAEAH